jgi:hypothetical protein
MSEVLKISEEDDEGDEICKYCLQGREDNQRLVYPCDCTTGVHPSCLTSWINFRKLQQGNESLECELCKKKYKSVQLIMLIGNSVNNGGNLIESKYSERSLYIEPRNLNHIKKCGYLEIFFYGISGSSLSAIFAIHIVDEKLEKENVILFEFLFACINVCFLFGLLISLRRLRKNRIIRQENNTIQRNDSYFP